MLARLRENIALKILALTVAILLHMYVANQQNPSQTRSVTIPITVKNLPPGLLLVNKPGSVMVNLTGASEELGRVGEMNVTATVDLRHAGVGTNSGLPIDVELTPAAMRTTVNVSDVKPRQAAIQLVERRRRRIPISVETSGTSATGFVARKPSLLVPSIATATGPANEVDSIARLIVKPDITGATDTVDDDYQILPVDAQGNEVPNVQVSPETAHVQIGVVEAGRTKDVFITPKITGAPAPGFVIGNVVVKPATMILSGAVDQLSNVSSVSTESIDIQGANADITKQVHAVAPTGTTSPGATPVTVTIQIIPATAPAQPAAAPQTH